METKWRGGNRGQPERRTENSGDTAQEKGARDSPRVAVMLQSPADSTQPGPEQIRPGIGMVSGGWMVGGGWVWQ